MFKKRLLFFLLLGSLLVLVPVRSQNNLQKNEETLDNKVGDTNSIPSFTSKALNEKMMSLVEVKEITAYVERGSIEILNNSAFGSDGYDFPGFGTSGSPYLIQDYNITDDTSELINISNTNVHFEVRNCYLDGLGNANDDDIIVLNNVTHGSIINNTITNTTKTGIHLISNSTANLCKDNLINFCLYDGIYVEDSNDNVFLNNTLFDCEYAIDLSNSNHTIISGNNISGSYPSVVFSNGIYLSGCNNNSISSNTIINPSNDGIELTDSSNENNITMNLVINSTAHGINAQSSSSYNLIYHNFLLNNNIGGSQGFDNSLSNSWDNGTHGNYWSDYAGPDDVEPYGIGETNYTLDGGLLINDTKPLVSILNLTGPGTMYYEADAPTNTISWYLTANLIGSYYLYQDKVLSTSGNWTTEPMIQAYLPPLVLNTVYNYTIVVSDISGNTTNDTVMVTARDTIAPEITYTGPSVRSFEFNTTGQTITVTATDMYPDTYVLYQNGTGSTPETWDSGTPITTSLDALPVGGYNFTLVVKDTSNNEATQTVLVTVTGTETTQKIGSFAEIFVILGSLGTLVVYMQRRRLI